MARLHSNARLEQSAGFARFTIGAPRQWLWKLLLWPLAALIAAYVGLVLVFLLLNVLGGV